MTKTKKHGIARGLTNYGDPEFAIYLRKSIAKSMGYFNQMLERPIVGIAYILSGFNNCHRHFPEMLEAVKRGVIAAGAQPVKKHLTILNEGDLISVQVSGRSRLNTLNADGLRRVFDWFSYFDAFWDNRLNTLKTEIEKDIQ